MGNAMHLGEGQHGNLPKEAVPLHAERFGGGLAVAHWTIRQRGPRRAHLLIIESRSGTALLRGTSVAFEAPALVWLPSDLEGEMQVEAGARGYLLSISEDFLDPDGGRQRGGVASAPHPRSPRAASRRAARSLVRRHHPLLRRAGQRTAITAPRLHDDDSSQLLLLCLYLWRAAISERLEDAPTQRGDGPRLVGNFLQLVELHYRDNWSVARYASTLGVTDDKLHSHCKREEGRSPRAIIHARVIREACTRLLQLDLPVEQIG